MQTLSSTALRRMGNSTGMIVPRAVLDALGAKSGDRLDLAVENGQLVAAPAGRLSDQISISADEFAELEQLAAALNGAAARMEKHLDEASEAVQKALDPQREADLRARFERELKGMGEGLFGALAR